MFEPTPMQKTLAATGVLFLLSRSAGALTAGREADPHITARLAVVMLAAICLHHRYTYPQACRRADFVLACIAAGTLASLM